MAPEVIGGKPYTELTDVFSFGIILWEIAAREPPYKSKLFKYYKKFQLLDVNGLDVA